MDAIPPTRVALTAHSKGCIPRWALLGKTLQISLDLPSQQNTSITGNHCGLPYLRQANHPGSYGAVAAKKGAEDSASAREQSSVRLLLVSVCVAEIAMTI